jgi:hypothetical protein
MGGRQAELAERFRRFGARECAHVSPLYARLSLLIATDPELLTLAAHGDGRGQPVPNLIFAAVQYLLLGGIAHPLARFYPVVGGDTALPEPPEPWFRDFCMAHAAPIRALLEARLVQTNEVRRCALTLPALAIAAESQPIALIEVGASAGLNLLLDQYRYRYGAQAIGNPGAPLTLHCDARGAPPPLPAQLPAIAWRVGIDLSPIDVRDQDATRWLRALIWPEQTDRALLLQQALANAERHPPELWAGDAIELLPQAIAAAPRDAQICLVHTFTLNQFSPAMRLQLDAQLAAASHLRRIAVVGVEWREPMPPITLAVWEDGHHSTRELATCDPHGAWIAWHTEHAFS